MTQCTQVFLVKNIPAIRGWGFQTKMRAHKQKEVNYVVNEVNNDESCTSSDLYIRSLFSDKSEAGHCKRKKCLLSACVSQTFLTSQHI